MRIGFRALAGILGGGLVAYGVATVAAPLAGWGGVWASMQGLAALVLGGLFIGYSATGRESLGEQIQAMRGGPDEVVVNLFTDRMEAYMDGRSTTVRPKRPYVGRRLLIGDFGEGENCLRRAVAELRGPSRRSRGKPAVVLTAMERCEGGLDELEIQLLRELGGVSGAGRVLVCGQDGTYYQGGWVCPC